MGVTSPKLQGETEDPERSGAGERRRSLNQWQLMWRKFKKHHLGVLGLIIVVSFYFVAVFADFFAPYPVGERSMNLQLRPVLPQFVDAEGEFHLRPFVYAWERQMDRETFRRIWAVDTSATYDLHFFVRGSEYKLLGLIPTNIHLFGVEPGGHIYLFGTDNQGRDIFSRVLFASRVSLSIGLVGVCLTLFIGSVLGIISGYFGGVVDNMVQRLTELLIAFPHIPLWMALAAAFPATWSSLRIYFFVTIILSIISWGALARQVRGLVLSLREREFVLACQVMGADTKRIVFRHLLPNCASHVIVVATLSVPFVILSETALSFLGLGIRPPMTSWGTLLEAAQNVRALTQQPWYVLPAGAVIMAVLGFNFLGDGLRDAADPYSE